MEKPASTLSKEELSKRISGLSFGSRRVEVDPMQWLYRERAAVRVECDLNELQPPADAIGAGTELALQKVLAESTVVDTVDGHPAWRLRHDVRKETLKRLAEQGRLLETLDDNPALHHSTLQTMLDSYIRGNPPAIDAQSLPELEATLQVVEWLDGCLPALPDPDQLRRVIARERLLKPFRFLVGSHFRGRSEELRLLRDYVGVLVDERSEASPPDLPLLIYGPGGIGKSTLIAKFILDHADPEASRRLPYVYIDFNRRDVDIQEPISLLVEAVRQLAIQYPVDEKRWTGLHEQWRRNLDDLALDSPAQKSAYGQESITSARRRGWNRYVFEFVDAVAGILQAEQPFLIVLDTLEELLFHNREYLGDLWDFLDLLRGEVPLLRVVLSGRSTLPIAYRVQERLLDGLDSLAAVDLLLERGIPNGDFARQIIEVVGRSPLSLCLAAELYRRMEGDMQVFADLEARQEYFYQVKEYLIQGLLYRRILGHIHDRDPRLQSLAHPGLVLRRVTPELILNVLAEGCQIDIKDIDDARILFAQLRDEIAVVEINQPDPNELRQRPELRLAMLELLLQDDREKVRRIHQLAVAYFEKRVAAQSPADLRDRADLVYHRLALEEAPAFLDGYALDEIQAIADELGSTIQDLPVGAQTYLVSRVKVDIQLDPGVWEAADLKSWEQMTARSVQRQLNLRAYADALAQLTRRQERSLGSPLYPLHVLAQIGLDQIDDARQTLEEGIRRTPPNSAEMQDLLLLAASMDETAERFADAAEHYRRALHIARRLGNETTAFNTQLDIVRLTHVLYAPEAPETQQEYEALLQLWRGMDDETLLEHPYLLRNAATQVGAETPDLVKQAVRLLGLGSERPTNLNALASALASWDDLRSTELDQQSGALAQQVKVEWRGDLYTTWLTYLQEIPWERAARDLAHLVEEHPLTPTMSITLVDLLKTRLLLTSEQAILLQSLLVDSFSLSDLDQLLRSELDIDVGEVSRAKEFDRQVADLVSWVETNGRLVHLLQVLVIARPENPQLHELLDLVGISIRSAEAPTEPEAQIAAARDQLERARQRADAEAEAEALFNLGLAYQGRSKDDSGEDLEQALAFCEQALSFYKNNDPGRAAAIQYAMGAIYSNRTQGDRQDNQEKALDLFQQAANIYTRANAPNEWAAVQYGLGTIYRDRLLGERAANLEQALAHYEEALETDADMFGVDHPQVARDAAALGSVYYDLGRPHEAIPYYEQALAVARSAGDRSEEGNVLGSLGNAYAALGENRRAMDYYEQRLAIAQEADDHRAEAIALANLGVAARRLGETQRALAYLERALPIARDLKDSVQESITLANMGLVYAELGASQRAVEYSEQALVIARQLGDLQAEGTILGNLGLAYADLGELQRAVEYDEQALAIFQQIGDRSGVGNVLNTLGLAYAALGETQRAIDYYQQALQLAREIGNRLVEANVQGNLGLAFSSLGQFERAVEQYQAQLAIVRSINDPRGRQTARANLGDAYFRLGRYEQAIEQYQAALSLAQDAGDRNGAGDYEFFLGLSHLELGRPGEAQRHLETAVAIYTELDHANLEDARAYLEMAIERAEKERGGTVVSNIDTGGGAYISGNVNAVFSDFVGRDKVVYESSVETGKGINVGGESSGQARLEQRISAICRGEVALQTTAFRRFITRTDSTLYAASRDGISPSPYYDTPTYHTAFLVGPNLVLTAYHTVREVIEGRLPPQNLAFRFDLLSTRASEILSQGQAYALAVGREAQATFGAEQPWLVAANPMLDYALLRLARPAGEETVGGLRQSRPRGWLSLAESASFASSDGLGIIYFLHGAQLTANYQQRAFLGYSENGLRIVHQLETSLGASGAPILDKDQSVVGIHLGRGSTEPPEANDARRYAVFVPAVVDDLKAIGIWPLSAPFVF